MIVESLEQLVHEFERMGPGHRLDLDPHLLPLLWPTPPIFLDDGGFAGPMERGRDWCERQGFTMYEQHDPHVIVIVPIGTTLERTMTEAPSWDTPDTIDHFFDTDNSRYRK